jgi:hypothetical protein
MQGELTLKSQEPLAHSCAHDLGQPQMQPQDLHDRAARDEQGYIRIKGRSRMVLTVHACCIFWGGSLGLMWVVDVINVSRHQLSTAEIGVNYAQGCGRDCW